MDALEAHLQAQGAQFTEFFWHRLRWRAVSDYIPPRTRLSVLDIGAGAGHFGVFLRQKLPLVEYYFVEPLPSLEQQLEARFGAEHNARHWSRLSGIRVITLLDVLEHEADDAAFLASIVERADAGTTIVITVPARQALWSQWDVALGHHRRYERAALTELFEPLDVDVLEVSYLFPELVLPGRWRAWRSRRNATTTGGDDAQFPNLPRVVNRSLYRICSPAVIWRRRVPTGSSLLAVVRRR